MLTQRLLLSSAGVHVYMLCGRAANLCIYAELAFLSPRKPHNGCSGEPRSSTGLVPDLGEYSVAARLVVQVTR